MLSRTSKLLLVAALVAGSLAIAAPPVSAVPTYTVKAKSGDQWSGTGPQRITHAAKPGAKVVVVWKNPTNRRGGHDVKSLNVGKKWFLRKTHLRNNSKNSVKKTFKKTGRYWFRCTIHSAKVGGEWTGMVGQVHVFRPGR